MKCIDRKRMSRKRRRRNRCIVRMSMLLIILCFAAVTIYYLKKENAKAETLAAELEKDAYRRPVYREEVLFSDDLCVASQDVSTEKIPDLSGIHSAGLFDLNGKEVDFSYRIHDTLYPASTTKILTALVAIKNGNLSDMVTVSENAAASSFAYDEQVCGLSAGDTLTLEDLLYGLILNSGNDNAVAIAEHISGNQESFAELMNAQAAQLMATNSHFVNANGLHSAEHYTTAYDLYLIFNECIKHPAFLEMIRADAYTAHITKADGSKEDMEFAPTNYYASGAAPLPEGATVIGGKTGTTDEAGNCLILLNEDGSQNPYISIVMGAASKELLYQDMTEIINSISINQM